MRPIRRHVVGLAAQLRFTGRATDLLCSAPAASPSTATITIAALRWGASRPGSVDLG